jgi:hypothetical protein
MGDKVNSREAAISAFWQREAEAARASSGHIHAQLRSAQRQEMNLIAWSTSACGAISMGVTQASNDFAQRGSPFVIRQSPDRRRMASFEVRRCGSPYREATLSFVLDPYGIVRAETDAPAADLPDGVAVGAVTPQWAEQAAEQVMFAVLGRKRSRSPTTTS